MSTRMRWVIWLAVAALCQGPALHAECPCCEQPSGPCCAAVPIAAASAGSVARTEARVDAGTSGGRRFRIPARWAMDAGGKMDAGAARPDDAAGPPGAHLTLRI